QPRRDVAAARAVRAGALRRVGRQPGRGGRQPPALPAGLFRRGPGREDGGRRVPDPARRDRSLSAGVNHMRVASAGLYRQVLDAIGRNQSDIARLQLQVATGKRMLAPSDDPSGTVRGMHLRNAIEQLAQFQANGARAAQRLGLEDNTLQQVVDTLQRVSELAVQSQNDTETDETRGIVTTELRSILDQLVQLANSTDGEGEYLFAGYKSNDAPFVLGASGVSYLGDQSQRMLQIGPSRQVAAGDPGSAVFLDIPDGNGTFATSAAGANAGTGIVDGGSVTDYSQWDGGSYT